MKIKRLDNLFLGANDLEQARSFYTQTLGLGIKFDFSHNGLLAFKIGDDEPAIILKNLGKYPKTQPTIWFEVDSVWKAYEVLKSKKVTFLSEPFKISTGWAVEFLDPSSNKLGLTDYLAD
ncbi:MAG TPA: VOC family protein [Flavobacteriaceae bacterium]|nr:VOC family protein [Flavobacteriaceae bacterium]MCB9212066.1 VOC family protein [Alteromonas sp.]HPF09838.1 VOC family protein [Flavobacteriaceae bacterium]HQU22042.1 VOC family protein [Flavobacteriaceae bacterium]HQU64077.1 VOC family protein [Flavobacteriaceae bacterium]